MDRKQMAVGLSAVILAVTVWLPSTNAGSAIAKSKSKEEKAEKKKSHSQKKEKKSKKDARSISATPPANCSLDSRTNKILNEVASFYAGLNTLQTRMIQTMEVSAGAKKIDLASVVDVLMKRPDSLSMKLRAGLPGGNLLCDGDEAYFYSQILNEYSVVKSPGDLEKLFLDPNSKIVNGPYALFSLLPSLIGKDPYQSILAGVTKGEYAGVDTIDGIECNHMTFTQDTFSWDLWTQIDGQPWVVKVAPALFPDSALAKPIIKTTGKLSLNFRYKNSIANAKLKDSAFAFDAPPESKQIPSLGSSAETADALKAGSEDRTSSASTDDDKPSPNLGKPSPPLKGSLMDGGTFDLAEYKGKKVVVLEFFAGWCPDCRKTLPAVHKTVKPYLHKDVVFYLVDQPDHENKPDNEDKVKEYLKAHDLPVPVIQDGERKAHTDFGVRPIPHLVVVDKEGVIRFDQSSMTLDADLERELKKLSTQE